MLDMYRRLAERIGTAEALDLGDRLSAWHDAMVMHERGQRRRDRFSPCPDDCPHALAAELWAEAQNTFGRYAFDLQFLRSRGVTTQGAGAACAQPSLAG